MKSEVVSKERIKLLCLFSLERRKLIETHSISLIKCMQLLQRKIMKSFLRARIPKECRKILAGEIVFLHLEFFRKVCLEWYNIIDTVLKCRNAVDDVLSAFSTL